WLGRPRSGRRVAHLRERAGRGHGHAASEKDVKIKGQLDYAELSPGGGGLLYISRPDAATNAEVNVIDLAAGELKFKDAIESGKPLSSSDYNAARYALHHVVEGTTLYVFASHDHRLYA